MTSSETDSAIISLLTEYIPKKKVVYTNTSHALNKSYICSNPRGPVSNSGCPEDDPLCNCPCKELRPTSNEVKSIEFCKGELPLFNSEDAGKIRTAESDHYAIIKQVFEEVEEDPYAIGTVIYELVNIFETEEEAYDVLWKAISGTGTGGESAGVTYDEPKDSYLDSLLQSSSECSKIKSVLGSEWLGCDWENPNSPFSCNCPCVGEKYHYYLRLNRTMATFWDTPGYVPLISKSHKAALTSQQVAISIVGDLSIRPGDIIYLDLTQPPWGTEEIEDIIRKYGIKSETDKNAKFSGRWMVATIKHIISAGVIHKMDLILFRDGLPENKEDNEE